MTNKFIILFFSITLICLSFNLNGQTLDHKLGEFIIKTEYPIKDVLRGYQIYNGERTKLQVKKKIAPSFNIYLVQFDFTKIHEERFKQELSKNNLIDEIQYNHIVSKRAVPNDPQFDNQWQYINTGQAGGVTGADLDIEQAWDITTGGVTALGDTIVAAIIDDGLDWNHADFGDNLWVNHDEIPNNGIDDDNNGYTDDYQGWNAYTGTGVITGGGHGTPVAGIVGAKGNNNIGVSGVNWDVKLMIIQGGGDEADALAAYAYCLAERNIYNMTNGAEGSFVVTTNASWGIDQGQPSDAPLWCGLYDTMGEEGILSCGATANANFNIDVIGDLPTGCPSDYLLSVTNLDQTDEKVNSAGYGLVTIDLGAYGENTWNTASGNSYGGFGGTSGATPHVAGTVALMYATPCPSFAAFAKADPAAAALQVRQNLLNGVVANSSLDGITVTGGRLNTFNAVNNMVTTCDPSGCFAPYNITTENIIDISAEVSWSEGDDAIQSDMRYKEQGTNNWILIPNVNSPYSLTGLMSCTEYEIQIQSTCDSGTTDWSNSFIFITDGCCEPPSNVMVNSITDNNANVIWDPVFGAVSYNIQIKETIENTWTTINVMNEIHDFSDLIPCTTYEIQVQTICSSGAVLGYSPIIEIVTTGCGACTDLTYCTQIGDESDFEWIESINIHTFTNTSGNDGGYGDYTDTSIELMQGNSYSTTLSPGFDGFPYDEYFAVWIDFNQDGDFDEANELVLSSGSTQMPITEMISIPITASLGTTRMRVAMRYEAPVDLCTSFDYGEVEDYCVTIVESNGTSCAIPTGMIESAITETETTINWNAVPSASEYQIRYKEVSSSMWLTQNSTSADLILNGLQDCTEYEYQIMAICSGVNSSFSIMNTFTTTCILNCDTPTNIGASSILETMFDLSWDAMPNATSYNVRYKKVGDLTWLMQNTATNSTQITGLVGCLTYEFEVNSICSNGNSSYSPTEVVTTDCINSVESLNEIPFKTYPNPVKETLILEFDTNDFETLDAQIMDVSGKILAAYRVINPMYKIDMSKYTAGVYWIQVRNENKISVEKIIKL